MFRIKIADRPEIEAVYRESHALWGTGLSMNDYLRVWEEVERTDWANRYARFVVSVDEDGAVLSSLKHYRPLVRVGGRTSRATVIGAVFTPRSRRGKGHASALVRGIIEQSRERRDILAMLFSDIGTAYYETLGFRALPGTEHWGGLPRKSREPDGDWIIRPMAREDLTDVRRAHDDSHAHRPFAIVRDEDHWRFLETRAETYFDRVRDSGVHQRTIVAKRDGVFAGYLSTVEGGAEWNIREAGAVGGAPDDIADLVRLGAIAARQGGLRKFYGWLAPDVAERLTDWKIRSGPRKRAVPMVLPLDTNLDLGPLSGDPTIYIPYQDQF